MKNKLLLLCIACCAFLFSFSQCPFNLDFEQGTTAGWGWRRWRGRWRRIGVGCGHDGAVGDALEDKHQAGDDDDDGPAVAPVDDVEGVEQEEDADEGDPDGAAKGAEEPELIAGGAVVCDAGAGVGHSADKKPDAKADEEEGNDPVDGEGVEQAGVADEEEAA